MGQEKSSKLSSQSENKKQIWLWVLMGCMTFIFILAIAIFVGGWWIFKDKVQDNLDLVEDEPYFESEDWLQDFDEFIENSEISNGLEPNIINGTEKFVSNEYGFILNFTDNWSNYKAELIVSKEDEAPVFEDLDRFIDINDETDEQLQQGFVGRYIFYYLTEEASLLSNVEGYEDIFSLDMYRLDEYDAIKSGELKEIARNNIYVFTYSNYYIQNQDTDIVLPQDVPQVAIDDIKTIAEGIETFDVRVLE